MLLSHFSFLFHHKLLIRRYKARVARIALGDSGARSDEERTREIVFVPFLLSGNECRVFFFKCEVRRSRATTKRSYAKAVIDAHTNLGKGLTIQLQIIALCPEHLLLHKTRSRYFGT